MTKPELTFDSRHICFLFRRGAHVGFPMLVGVAQYTTQNHTQSLAQALISSAGAAATALAALAELSNRKLVHKQEQIKYAQDGQTSGGKDYWRLGAYEASAQAGPHQIFQCPDVVDQPLLNI